MKSVKDDYAQSSWRVEIGQNINSQSDQLPSGQADNFPKCFCRKKQLGFLSSLLTLRSPSVSSQISWYIPFFSFFCCSLFPVRKARILELLASRLVDCNCLFTFTSDSLRSAILSVFYCPSLSGSSLIGGISVVCVHWFPVGIWPVSSASH